MLRLAVLALLPVVGLFGTATASLIQPDAMPAFGAAIPLDLPAPDRDLGIMPGTSATAGLAFDTFASDVFATTADLSACTNLGNALSLAAIHDFAWHPERPTLLQDLTTERPDGGPPARTAEADDDALFALAGGYVVLQRLGTEPAADKAPDPQLDSLLVLGVCVAGLGFVRRWQASPPGAIAARNWG